MVKVKKVDNYSDHISLKKIKEILSIEDLKNALHLLKIVKYMQSLGF